MENRFTARKIDFDGTPGYIVCQYHDGEKVVVQFVSEKDYEEFCSVIGIEPIMIG